MAAPARRTWSCGPVTISLDSNDALAADWLSEVLEPWFRPTLEAPDWRLRVSSSAPAYAELKGRLTAGAGRRACFGFDQRALSLPAWSSGGRVVLADMERSCFLVVAPSETEIVGDPCTRRWRIMAMWAMHEIAATRLRRTQLDLHAAAVETGGRTLLVSGPKGAGKTTLFLHLLCSGRFRAIANDRVFVGAVGKSFVALGIPTAVRIRPPTVDEFPEVRRGLPDVERPYLYTLEELDAATVEPRPGPEDLLLSPAQVLHQLRVEAVGSAPLTAVVFPRIEADVDGWALERLAPEQVEAAVWTNLYGGSREHGSTVFEDLDGGTTGPSRSLIGAISETVPGYRLDLGRRAYADLDLARRLGEIVHRP
jgi:hypothetical protein